MLLIFLSILRNGGSYIGGSNFAHNQNQHGYYYGKDLKLEYKM